MVVGFQILAGFDAVPDGGDGVPAEAAAGEEALGR